MRELNTSGNEGLSYIGDAFGGAGVLFSVGPCRLRFRREEFYRFVVFVMDAQPTFDRRYCPHGNRIDNADAVEGVVELHADPGFGRIYECPDCDAIHVDVLDQRIVVGPGSYYYLLNLLRTAAAQIEAACHPGEEHLRGLSYE